MDTRIGVHIRGCRNYFGYLFAGKMLAKKVCLIAVWDILILANRKIGLSLKYYEGSNKKKTGSEGRERDHEG